MMNIGSISSSFNGIYAGMSKLDRASANISVNAAGGDVGQLSQAVVDQKASANEVGMAVNVLKAKDQMLGSLIDIKA